jgi:2-keto-4-pentenoate hydratase/2-oxohepta-3-ene-1,7-dioic acid hydratase in catechol pathway
VITKIKGNPILDRGIHGVQLLEEKVSLGEVKLLMPIENPKQIIAIGLNYKAHIEEFKQKAKIALPEFPIIFMIAQSALANPEDQISLPFKENRTDYEAELVAVIGKEAFQISEEDALDYIFGYTCGNDISDRDVQKQDQQWTRAKSYPGFKPVGPWIETELDPSGLQLTTRVNGEVRQTGNTSSMIFTIEKLVARLSSVMKLYPGDLIFTGTPSGIGPLKPKDICEIEIQEIGVLRNHFV